MGDDWVSQTWEQTASQVRDFSIESGELMPSLKLKRAVIAANNKEAIDALYA